MKNKKVLLIASYYSNGDEKSMDYFVGTEGTTQDWYKQFKKFVKNEYDYTIKYEDIDYIDKVIDSVILEVAKDIISLK